MSFEENFNVGEENNNFNKKKIIVIISAIVGFNILAGVALAWFFYYKSSAEVEDSSETTKYSEKNDSFAEETETKDLPEGHFYSDVPLDNEEFKKLINEQNVEKLKERHEEILENFISAKLKEQGILWESLSEEEKEEMRIKSRNGRRISDIKQLQLALELYYSTRGKFPDSLKYLVGDYIYSLPKDPLDNTDYFYEKISDKQYHVGVNLEFEKDAYQRFLGGDEDIVTSYIDGGDEDGCNNEPDRMCYDSDAS